LPPDADFKLGGRGLKEDLEKAHEKEGRIMNKIIEKKDPCWKGYEQVGMKMKKGKKVPNCVPETGKGLFDSVKATYDKAADITHKVIHGRMAYPPSAQKILDQYGDKKIASLDLHRCIVPEVYTNILNVWSQGELKKRLATEPKDKLYHISIWVHLEGGPTILCEKNEVINLKVNPKTPKGEETQAARTPNVSFGELMEKGQKLQGDDKWFSYSAKNNNCGNWIEGILMANNLDDKATHDFIGQDADKILEGFPNMRKFVNTLTGIAAKANVLKEGGKLKGRGAGSSNLLPLMGATTLVSIIGLCILYGVSRVIVRFIGGRVANMPVAQVQNLLGQPGNNIVAINPIAAQAIQNQIAAALENGAVMAAGLKKKHSGYSSSSDSDSDSDSPRMKGGALSQKVLRKLYDWYNPAISFEEWAERAKHRYKNDADAEADLEIAKANREYQEAVAKLAKTKADTDERVRRAEEVRQIKHKIANEIGVFMGDEHHPINWNEARHHEAMRDAAEAATSRRVAHEDPDYEPVDKSSLEGYKGPGNGFGRGLNIDFDDLKWGSFTKQFERFKHTNPKAPIHDLEAFARHIIADPKDYNKTTLRRARFYVNVLLKKSHHSNMKGKSKGKGVEYELPSSNSSEKTTKHKGGTSTDFDNPPRPHKTIGAGAVFDKLAKLEQFQKLNQPYSGLISRPAPADHFQQGGAVHIHYHF